MKKCSNCGNPMSDFALVCKNCGKEVVSSDNLTDLENHETSISYNEDLKYLSFGDSLSKVKKEKPEEKDSAINTNENLSLDAVTEKKPSDEIKPENNIQDEDKKISDVQTFVNFLNSFGNDVADETISTESEIADETTDFTPEAEPVADVNTDDSESEIDTKMIINALDSFGFEETLNDSSEPSSDSNTSLDKTLDYNDTICSDDIVDSFDESNVTEDGSECLDDTVIAEKNNHIEERPSDDGFVEEHNDYSAENNDAYFDDFTQKNNIIVAPDIGNVPVASAKDNVSAPVTDNKSNVKDKKVKEKKTKNSSAKKGSSKTKVIIAVCVSVVLIILGIVFFFTISNNNEKTRAEEAIGKIENIVLEYESKDISYSFAMKELEKYVGFEDDEVLLKYNAAKEIIEELYAPRKLYDDGVASLQSGDYVNAFECLNQIPKDYSDYAEVEKQIEFAKEEYKEYAFAEIDKYLNKYDFTSAKNILNELKIYVNDVQVNDKGQEIIDAKFAFEMNSWAEDFMNSLEEIEDNNDELMYTYRAEQKVYINATPKIETVNGMKKMYLDVKNASDKDTKKIVYSILEYDELGAPVDIEFGEEYYKNESLIDHNITIGAGELYSMKDSIIYISTSDSDTVFALACVKEVEFADGTLWINPYYKYWVEEYHDSYLS